MASERRVVRFFGQRGDLVVADPAGVAVCDAAGGLRFRIAVDGVQDVVAVGAELWVVARAGLTRIAIADGEILSVERVDGLDAPGWFIQSSTVLAQPVWHGGDVPLVVAASPGRAEPIGPAARIALPMAPGRWLLWDAGQLRYWRTNIGEAWRRQVGDPAAEAIDAQLVLDGRFLVVVQRRGGDALRLTVAQAADGAQNLHVRMPNVTHVTIAARRGIALAWGGEQGRLFDLRFGRWIRELAVPEGVENIVVDDGLERVALVFPHSVELADVESLVAGTVSRPAADAEANHSNGHIAALPDDVAATDEEQPPDDEPAPVEPPADEPLSDDVLVRLEPMDAAPIATVEERTLALDLQLRLVGALANHAIANAWDDGRIVTAAPNRPPFSEELGGLLRITRGLRAAELADAYDRLRGVDALVDAAQAAREGRATPLERLTRDFGLSPLASVLVFAIAAPRLRGELARVFGILANDPGRPLVDEHLLATLVGDDPQVVSRELDADRPLRRHGLVHLGAGTRPFAALTVEPLVVRYLADQDLDGETDDMLTTRAADRPLEELDLPRIAIVNALRYLAAPPEGEHARIVVRGRTGAGRHTLLAALAARVGRALGVIDLTAQRDPTLRDPTRIATTLEGALRRAKLRGLVPCVDGLDLVAPDDPDLRMQITAVLRRHLGPLAVRLPPEARPPLDPGYLMIELPARSENERAVSWTAALRRHAIELADASDLAARYRVGPGLVERVCSEVARNPNRPADAAGWIRTLDDAVRQHLVNRIGGSASRVSHLASWADIVLPEDISDSLLEITSRVRNRKKVFEQWGFGRSITTARGITALFQGSPGTGKTMVAGVIARDLGLELYRVDVSRITSKWIGETEKNLGALFDAAEEGQVMLLFDEADSLFAKRTEVKTSVDRYANQEVNYLLQRIDSFEGVAILTTNFGNSIDSAFKRRLTYRVTFPFPDEEMREQLWRSLLPSQVPIAGTLDYASLAQRFRLSGGYIRNAALRAAFLAVEEGSSLTQAHIERAIRMEFREIGKLAETGALE